MSEYIKKEDVYQILNIVTCVGEIKPSVAEIDIEAFESIPAEDVEPVVRGEWVWKAPYMVCSACGRHSINRFRAAYCQHCGAKMSNPRGAHGKER